jgi:L-ascorbate metabolism protein UlaG (beta-lactamase superfamily)
MPSKDIIDLNPAAILSTHGHPDHTDANFTSSYDTKTVLYTKEDFDLKDFHIYTIYSSHSGDTISNNNVIIVLEVDGLRIAHMGDIGQTKLTEEQLKELGTIDIAFMQFENSYSGMNLTNLKGFNLIEQLNPKIIIPTHFIDKDLPILEEKYGAITEYDNVLTISKDDLPDNTLNVYRILNNHVYK